MAGIIQLAQRLGPVRLGALAAVAIALAGFFIFLTSRLTQTEMGVLFSELDAADSGRIVSKLEALKVPYQISPDGLRIMVPADQAPRLRMAMAEDGLPSGGAAGYELIDKSSALGTTSFVQRINQVRALEGELARSIRSLGPVRAARVHLVMPRREVFARDAQEPTASIVISLRPGVALARSQVAAIQNLVASAVPKLAPGRVSVVDDRGNLLARGEEEDKSGKLTASTADDIRVQYEARRARTIEQMLERAVGVGKVRVEVTADLDFDRVETRSEEYDPDSVVARSVQEVTRENKSNETDPNKSVSVQNNLPDRNTQTSSTPGARQSSNTETERTENNEISRKVVTHLREAGQLKRMTVSVLVDGTYQGSKDATPVYQARKDEELEKIAALVRAAIGYDEKRGDKVEVVNMQFVRIGDEIGEEEPAGSFLGLTRPDMFRMAEIAVLGILALLALLLVFRPALNRILAVAAPAAETALAALPAGQAQAALAGPAGVAMTTAADGSLVATDGSVVALAADAEDDNLIDISRVEGRVKASSLKRIGDLVEKHPDEAVGILRHWMYQQS